MSSALVRGEFERIALLRAVFGDRAAGYDLAIGDDCAVLAPVEGQLVWSIDAAVEGTHFRRDLMTLEDAGFRATMAALSDLAAMGATPRGVTSALILPREVTDEDLLAIARGQRAAADVAGTAIVGGNLARGPSLSITTSVLGVAARPLTRAGARAGDGVFVAGLLGHATLGLALAQRGREDLPDVLRAFRRPSARILEGLSAAKQGATACIDVSDGLASDAAHLADASGLSVELDGETLEAMVPRDLCDQLGTTPLDAVLSGGEDYAIVATAPSGLSGFTKIGRCVVRREAAVYVARGGHVTAASSSGFDHFR